MFLLTEYNMFCVAYGSGSYKLFVVWTCRVCSASLKLHQRIGRSRGIALFLDNETQTQQSEKRIQSKN